MLKGTDQRERTEDAGGFALSHQRAPGESNSLRKLYRAQLLPRGAREAGRRGF